MRVEGVFDEGMVPGFGRGVVRVEGGIVAVEEGEFVGKSDVSLRVDEYIGGADDA